MSTNASSGPRNHLDRQNPQGICRGGFVASGLLRFARRYPLQDRAELAVQRRVQNAALRAGRQCDPFDQRAARLRTLEDENRRLKTLLAESMLDVSALKGLLGKN